MYFGQAAAATPVVVSTPPKSFDLAAAMNPVWSGFIVGLTGYTIAKAMDIPSNKAAGLGLALGATLAIGEIGSSWLKGYLAKAQAQQQPPTATQPASPQSTPAPALPAPAPIQVASVGRW